MKDTPTDLMHDDHPTGTISKHPLSELHQGEHEAPLTATGLQEVVVPHPMGSDRPDYKPTVAKGPTKDQAFFGGKGGSYPKQSISTGNREPKGLGRSKAKEMMSAEKHKAKY